MRTAERLKQPKPGVVALFNTGDQELDDYDDESAVFHKTEEFPDKFGT